jgi:hypothetical protein
LRVFDVKIFIFWGSSGLLRDVGMRTVYNSEEEEWEEEEWEEDFEEEEEEWEEEEWEEEEEEEI